MARTFWSHCIRDRDGNIKEELRLNPNVRTNLGIDWQANVMGKLAGQPVGMGYMGVTANGTTPLATDSFLASEYTASGMQRAVATYAHTVGATYYTLSVTFTATGNVSVAAAALFNATGTPPIGTMGFASVVPSAPNMVNGDQDTQVTTVNI